MQKPIIVIGAKPNAIFPAVEPLVVLTANNAATRGVRYREKYNAHLIAMSSSRALRTREDVQHSFMQAAPDEAIFLGFDIEDPTRYVREKLRLSHTTVSVLEPQERHRLLKKALGWRRFLLMAHILHIRGIKHLLTYVLPDLLGKRQFSWLISSTGLNAILYALEQFPDAKEIVAVGIGLQAGEHFSGKGVFEEKAALVDRLTLRYWPRSRRTRVFTTDDTMSAVGDVPKWEGENLSF